MEKKLMTLIFGILYICLGFFGIGPLLLADGSVEEKLFTLVIVVLLFVALSILFFYVLRKVYTK